jgi:predicted aspartyl protease
VGILTVVEVKKNDNSVAGKALFDRHNRLSSDFRWIFDNTEMLRSKYPDKYVAVKDQQVVFAYRDAKRLFAKLAMSGLSADDYAVEFVRKKPSCFLL